MADAPQKLDQAREESARSAENQKQAPKAQQPKVKHQPQEREFLPEAEELISSPVSPLSRILALTIAGIFVFLLAWSIIGKVDVIITSQGRLISDARVQVVQSELGGTIRSILVSNGDVVSKGQPLLELDPTEASADMTGLQEQLEAHEEDLSVYGALFTAFQQTVDPQTLSLTDEAAARVTEIWQQDKAALDAGRAQIDERQANIRTLEVRHGVISEGLPRQRERLDRAERLQSTGLISQSEIERLSLSIQTQEGELLLINAQIEEAQQAIVALETGLEAQIARRRAELSEQITQSQRSMVQVEEQMNVAGRRSRLQTLVSPVDGQVQQLQFFTVGGVVPPAAEVLNVAPSAYQLQGEAFLLNKDVGFVEPGMEVQVKLEAFPFTKYGFLEGEVRTISLDAVEDPNLGLVYEVGIDLLQDTLSVEGAETRVTPGMMAQVEIKVGKRRIIEFVLSPLLRFRDEAARER